MGDLRCGSNSVVECQLPKLNVVGSSPISRSTFSPAFFPRKTRKMLRNPGVFGFHSGFHFDSAARDILVTNGPLLTWFDAIPCQQEYKRSPLFTRCHGG